MRVLFLAKPVFYVVAFALAHSRFKAYGPHSKLPAWLAVLLASLARIALGVAGFFAVAAFTSSEGAFLGSLLGLGFLWWLLVAKAFFRHTPPRQLVVFAVIAEAMSALIDYLTMVDMQDFRLC
jgi:hypothetical protein